ncbi:MAG: phosphomethylpyrimidine synthase ThiC [Candidatus Omnitrophota bacterium]|nr:MAG: phosphomethylpyrimidine synthase ThiC [Candidatus Omnitrophota bacterium]
MTQLGQARRGVITPLMKRIAASEGISSAVLMRRIKEGRIAIPHNANRVVKKPCAVGFGLRTKINANIGTSTDKTDIAEELRKLETAEHYGADTVMDLSIGGQIRKIRQQILSASSLPVGTVPIYEISVNAAVNRKDYLSFEIKDILETLRVQAEDGVDFFTIHAGVTQKALKLLKMQKRLLSLVSRGGAILSCWMRKNKKENPFYEYFDLILDIACEFDITLSLGDGLRPGSILDATDKPQLEELKTLGKLAARARKRNVQVIIEGPGHVPLDQIKKNVLLEKRICRGAPFYVLGPLVTDVASGYDHISGSIGGALAASYGADFLCYVTPAEHLKHPSSEDVRDGVIASKIAAHAADIVKGFPAAKDWDKKMSEARRQRNWEKQIALSVDPEKAGASRMISQPRLSDVCTMCGEYCSIKITEESYL